MRISNSAVSPPLTRSTISSSARAGRGHAQLEQLASGAVSVIRGSPPQPNSSGWTHLPIFAPFLGGLPEGNLAGGGRGGGRGLPCLAQPGQSVGRDGDLDVPNREVVEHAHRDEVPRDGDE